MLNKNETYSNLSKRIYDFLEKYAYISPNYDPEYDDEPDKYTSPDASMLRYCADLLLRNIKPDRCFSSWDSGGYKPYTSKEGRIEHDYLVKQVYNIINQN